MDKVSVLVGLLVNKLVQIAGLKGWVAKVVLKYGGRLLADLIMNWYRKLKRQSDQTINKEKLDKVVADPNSKVEERADAYSDYLNGR